jgi:hypothetical protein
MNEEDDIFNMNLHEILHTDWYEILRVPGGWVYTIMSKGSDDLSSCFVPYSAQ